MTRAGSHNSWHDRHASVLWVLFLKVAELILDTEALAADKVSKTATGASWQSGVKRDCRNSVIKGSTECSTAKMNDNLTDSLKCGRKGRSKTSG